MKWMYDSAVIGGGAAGLTAAGISANFGAKTVMIESNRLGGECTWTGCVPSKTLINTASIVQSAKEASRYGLKLDLGRLQTGDVMKHVDRIRRDVYQDADKPEIYEEMGIDVEFGTAFFTDKHTVKVMQKDGSERVITAKYFFICTGSKPFVPEINGIEDVDYLTNESLFEIDNLPRRLLILGAGPVGTEMAQGFQRLDTEVCVVDMASRILTNDDPVLSSMLLEELQSEGIRYYLNSSVHQLKRTEQGITAKVSRNSEDEEHSVEADAILIAAGRRANIESLNLDAAGVKTYKKGISVNDKCRTNVGHIYAIGDVTGEYQFTHMGEHMAKVATSNALIKFPMKIDRKHVPWVTYTDPELAHVGATEKELREKGEKFEVYHFPFSKIDRAVTEGNTAGLIKIYAKKWSGKILGASILGVHAGEMISGYALAMKNSISLRNFADTIHPYPTYALGARRAADQWYIKNQSEGLVKWIQRIFRYRGEIPDYSDPDRIV